MILTQIMQQWYQVHRRNLPWRNTDSPYYIWLSEVILQQTRVAQGLDYYLRFVEVFPRLEDLASAPEEKVMKLWQGLGYYTRARNLHTTAKHIAKELKGEFPDNYQDLMKLKGIGKYTAAAIASIVYREPVAVVDGNVLRVLSRLFGVEESPDKAQGKTQFARLAQDILDTSNPGIHNQAIMELGALVCLPRNPRCGDCPLAKHCIARKNGNVEELPVRSGSKVPRIRHFNYLYIRCGMNIWLHQRNDRDIWQSLFELPLIETPSATGFDEVRQGEAWQRILGDLEPQVGCNPVRMKHQLTHQTVLASFYSIILPKGSELPDPAYFKISIHEMKKFAVPRLIDKFLDTVSPDSQY